MASEPASPGAVKPGNDPADMLGRILAVPDQLRAALELARRGPDLIGGAKPSRVWVVGMGGSAIGGDFLSAWSATRSSVPVDVVRGYDAPHGLDASSFAIFVSYSGNTEETLTVWEEAERRGVPRAVVTSGGELAARAEAAGVPVLDIPGGAPPRSALGWTSVPLVVAFARAGLAPFADTEIQDAAAACERTLALEGPEASGTGAVEEWARLAAHGLPIVHAPSARLAPAATRWICQLNENGKLLAHAALFPEHNHNEVVSWDAPSDIHRMIRAAFLLDDEIHPRVRRRMELVAGILEKAGGAVARFEAIGDGLLARLHSLAVLGDLASVYAAAERNIDPTPVAGIDHLKADLASEGKTKPE